MDINTINKHPRFKISLLSFLFPEHLDARVIVRPQANSNNKNEAKLGQVLETMLGKNKNSYMKL